jgi:hypothetical protein
MSDAPSPNGLNGRDAHGRFSAGNPGGPGNPNAKQVAELRSAMLSAVSVEQMRDIITKLIELARSGDVRAIKEVLGRTLGKPVEADFMERLDALETELREREKPSWT